MQSARLPYGLVGSPHRSAYKQYKRPPTLRANLGFARTTALGKYPEPGRWMLHTTLAHTDAADRSMASWGKQPMYRSRRRRSSAHSQSAVGKDPPRNGASLVGDRYGDSRQIGALACGRLSSAYRKDDRNPN